MAGHSVTTLEVQARSLRSVAAWAQLALAGYPPQGAVPLLGAATLRDTL